MSEENYEEVDSSGGDYENTEEETKSEAMLNTESLQSQFSGYYFDGKAGLEQSKQLDKLMVEKIV